jgi:hypothetical protein
MQFALERAHGCREIGDAKETADPLGDLGAQPAPGPV